MALAALLLTIWIPQKQRNNSEHYPSVDGSGVHNICIDEKREGPNLSEDRDESEFTKILGQVCQAQHCDN